MTGRTFCLLSCRTAIRGISPLGGPSSSSGYGRSQPLSIQACSSSSYCSLSHAEGDTPIAGSTRILVADHPTTSTTPSTHLCLGRIPRESQPRQGWLQRKRISHVGKTLYCQCRSVIPPSCVIESIPRSRSYPSSSHPRLGLVRPLEAHHRRLCGQRSLHNIPVSPLQQLTPEPSSSPTHYNMPCALGFGCTWCLQALSTCTH